MRWSSLIPNGFLYLVNDIKNILVGLTNRSSFTHHLSAALVTPYIISDNVSPDFSELNMDMSSAYPIAVHRNIQPLQEVVHYDTLSQSRHWLMRIPILLCLNILLIHLQMAGCILLSTSLVIDPIKVLSNTYMSRDMRLTFLYFRMSSTLKIISQMVISQDFSEGWAYWYWLSGLVLSVSFLYQNDLAGHRIRALWVRFYAPTEFFTEWADSIQQLAPAVPWLQ